MTQRLTRMAYDIGKRFYNGKLTIWIDSEFRETGSHNGGIKKAFSAYQEQADGHLCVFLHIPDNITDKEKEIRIAHEFGEIELRKNHPRISKMLHTLGYNRFLGGFPAIINDSLADMEARKRGFKIPYLYH